MELQILSDLHIEFAPYEMIDTDADVVVLAGDIHLGERGFKWARDNIPDKVVVYVLGNHEFYKAATPRLIEKLTDRAAGTNIHVLENRSVAIGGIRFLGCTLWTDFDLLDCVDISIAASIPPVTTPSKTRESSAIPLGTRMSPKAGVNRA